MQRVFLLGDSPYSIDQPSKGNGFMRSIFHRSKNSDRNPYAPQREWSDILMQRFDEKQWWT
ncbi:MAG: hypothetical protein EOO06_14355 [Chitinophagaceae bacterium]|nr:MAG: hypothetical protein EOO06_14355 [Chitinophagaceae bacterium]